MNVYTLQKIYSKIKLSRLKLFIIYMMHIFGRRYIGLFFDPVLACNLRCKMCYFSDENFRKKMRGQKMSREEVDRIAKAFFKRVLKFQIGCKTEPTLYKDLPYIIKKAKDYGVPYISMTTNANLLNEEIIEEYLAAGLDEFTISTHGVYKDTYEYFMTNAKHEKFIEVLKLMAEAKKKHDFKIRLNYTINHDNIDELGDLFEKIDYVKVDIIQLRPSFPLGNTEEFDGGSEYDDFDHTKTIEKYDSIVMKVQQDAAKHGIICISPTKEQLLGKQSEAVNSFIFDSTYCYVSPLSYWSPDFDKEKDTFKTYSKKTKRTKTLFKNIFYTKKTIDENEKKRFNYEIN